ncbi:MAG: hypothetical protein Q8O67_04915 [Deltaproteobacteria bacterium]|nr:hypothetical protein [Deltaproteobacteria bacterium]
MIPSKLLVPVLMIAVVGCPEARERPCERDSQCDEGEVCSIADDADVGVCKPALVTGEGEGEGEGEEGEGEGEGEEGEGEGEGEGESPVTARVVDVGGVFACAIDADNHVQCWGGNSRGQLGRVTAGQRDDVPAPIPGLTDVVDLALGEFHACALGRLNGGQQKLYCWGDPSEGSLGTDGNTAIGDLVEPELPPGFGGDVVDVDADGNNNGGFSCASDGVDTFCWGPFAVGALNGLPVRLNGLGLVDKLEVSLDGVCATSQTLVTTCVQLGTGLELLGCVEGARCTALDGGARFDSEVVNACVIDDGDVFCAGDNTFGVVNPGNRAPEDLPLTALINATAVSVGTQHACAVSGLTVKCWGRPIFGATGVLEGDTLVTVQCDDNPAVRCHGIRDVPMPAGFLSFATVKTHRTQSCAITGDGRLVCWGGIDSEDEGGRPHAVPLFH